MRTHRAFLMTVAVMTAASAGAQQLEPPAQAPQQSAAQPADAAVEAQLYEQLKVQVKNFEAVLRAAVESGGRRLQKRAAEVMPMSRISLVFSSEPVAMGVPHPDGGVVFTVQVPDLMGSAITLWEIDRKQQMNRPVAGGAPVRPEAEAGVPVIPTFDPDREYSDFVREGLIEAMIENSHALRLSEAGELVVVASVSETVRRNPLDNNRLLILSLRGEHLTAYRQNKLTKDEIKKLITDRRF